jgi:DNA helicase-2/ATP-dependent DNA helicase PcrA
MVDENRLRKELDAEQCKAALQISGPVLILAGAGSGKTRAVTYKIAHLISAHQVDPRRILAVTFTNKAAKEMKERIRKLLGGEAHLDWMGTFHGICLRILKLCLAQPRISEVMGWTYSRNFTIYDSDDQARTLKSVVLPILGEVESAELKKISGKISRFKNSMCLVADVAGPKVSLQTPELVKEQARFGDEEQTATFYLEYQNKLMAADAMDFDDLLFRTVQLFQKMPAVASQFANRFQQVFVDEFQDTNDIQFLLLRQMMNPARNVTVVGDDDQSIYGWRGANIGIIRSFHEDFAPVTIVKLERNYRSTSLIVKGAGSVIENNARPESMRKKVYSELEDGDPIRVFRVADDRVEADRIAEKIYSLGPTAYNETAIFYRTNAQSRSLEKALNDKRIPSVIFGGMRFWDRKEVKDLLAYLRILVNSRDDAALGRIINVPPRGIGKTSLEDLQAIARKQKLGAWEALANEVQLGTKLGGKFKAFHDMMEDLRKYLKDENSSLPILAEKLIEKSRYKIWIEEEEKDQAEERAANMGELVNALREFEEEHSDSNGGGGLEQFLQEVALLSDADKKVVEGQTRVTLMTIHMAKGLEFENVFLAGCDEGVFPLIRKSSLATTSAAEIKALEEEERRLFYVGATRAKRRLFIYSATQRFWQGTVTSFSESRFLSEIDSTAVERLDLAGSASEERTGGYSGGRSQQYGQSFGNKTFQRGGGNGFSGGSSGGYSRPQASNTIRKVYPGGIPDPDSSNKPKGPPIREIVYDEHSQENLYFKPGMMVRHARFGVGLIRGLLGTGPEAKVDVEFQDGVVRKLILKYANLTILQRE